MCLFNGVAMTWAAAEAVHTPSEEATREVKGLRRGSWEMVEDGAVGVYFYHHTTDESQWEPPECFVDDVRGVEMCVSPAPPRVKMTFAELGSLLSRCCCCR
jgi:hypothetical protein